MSRGASLRLRLLLALALTSVGCALPQQVGSDCGDEALCDQLRVGGGRLTGGGGISTDRSTTMRDVRRGGFIERADVLFVVNDSPAMASAQNALSAAIPAFVNALASGDGDLGGRPDFRAVRDLHLGVISGRMATSALPLPRPGSSCVASNGSDGVLSGVCLPPSARYSGTQSPATVAVASENLACMVRLGGAGCLPPQPFESALKALWPAEPGGLMPLTFPDGTRRGAVGNEGFLRPDSLIVVIVVSDVDDCSSTSPDELTGKTPEQLLHRCSVRPDVRAPLERYLLGLRQLRAGAEDLVMFFALAGVPPMVELAAGDSDPLERYYDAVLSDPRMQSDAIDPRDPTDSNDDIPRVMCPRDSGPVYPARRMVELAQAFGPNGMAMSLCEPDLQPALLRIAQSIGLRLGPPEL